MAVYTPETKRTKKLRTLMSFVLFAILVAFSLSVNLKTNAFVLRDIKEQFVSYNYIEGVREDAIGYANDLHRLNGVEQEGIEEALKYSDFELMLDAYFGFNITASANYSEESYLETIDIITDCFEENFTEQLERQEKEYSKDQLATVVDNFRSHLIDLVTVDHLSEIKAVTNVGNFAANIGISISLFLIAVTAVIIYYLGNKFRRYRSVRAITTSFVAAGFYDVIIAILAHIVFCFKSIDIYPIYFREQMMDYIYHFLNALMITGGALLFAAIALLTLTWKIRKGK